MAVALLNGSGSDPYFEIRVRSVDLTPVTAVGDWRDRLIMVLWSYTRILFEQPGLAQSVLVTRPSGPAYLSLAEGILALLSAGEIPLDRAAWAVDLLLHFATSATPEPGLPKKASDPMTTTSQDAGPDEGARAPATTPDPGSATQSPPIADPARLTTRLRLILTIVLLADVLDPVPAGLPAGSRRASLRRRAPCSCCWPARRSP